MTEKLCLRINMYSINFAWFYVCVCENWFLFMHCYLFQQWSNEPSIQSIQVSKDDTQKII